MEKNYELNIQSSVADEYEHYTHYNYNEWYALAEFIDNSTASFYLNEDILKRDARSSKLTVEINYDKTTNTLTIEDDAFGMDRENFDYALVAGKKPKHMGRNEFGYGLKTAATWFGRKWTIESSQYGSEKKYSGTIDLDELLASKKNTINIIESDEKYEKHYTKITITKVTKPLNTNKIKNDIIKWLNSIYRRDLISGRIEIIYNGVNLTFSEYKPLVYKGACLKKDIHFSFIVEEKEYTVNGFVGILNEGSYEQAGFILLRNNRGIVAPYKPKEIFVQAQNSISKNLYGELDMKDFSVNQFKNGFDWAPEVEETFIRELKQTIVDYIRIAKLTNKDREKEEKKYQEALSLYSSSDLAKENNEETLNDEKDGENSKPESKNITDYNGINNNQSDNNITICEYDIELQSNKYHIIWDKIEGNFFLYSFIESTKTIIINLNHNFAANCSINSRKDVSFLLVAYILADIEAKKSISEQGYVSSSKIKNTINKILG